MGINFLCILLNGEQKPLFFDSERLITQPSEP